MIRENRKKLTELLNDTGDASIFGLLMAENTGDKIKTDKTNKIQIQWEESSRFADTLSDRFIDLSELLAKMEEYFQLIIISEVLPMLIKKYKVTQNINELANHGLKLLQYEKENLCMGMLGRLQLAKSGLPDDVLSSIIKSLREVSAPKDYFYGTDSCFTTEKLSLDKCVEFFNYIATNGTERQKAKLLKLYYKEDFVIRNSLSVKPESNVQDKSYDCVNWQYMDLSGKKFLDASFLKADLSGSSLKLCDFRLCDLREANLRTIDACMVSFKGADGRGADLSWASANTANFEGANFSFAHFHGASLCHSNFTRCHLEDTDFRLSKLRNANFNGAIGLCNFDGADLSEADLTGMDISINSYKNAIILDVKIIKSETDDAIIMELDLLEIKLKNHPDKKELLNAILQDVCNKIESIYGNIMAMRDSHLIKHRIFAYIINKSSPFYSKKSFLGTFFNENVALNQDTSDKLVRTSLRSTGRKS